MWHSSIDLIYERFKQSKFLKIELNRRGTVAPIMNALKFIFT